MEKKDSFFAELRKEAGFTQKTLAEALHVTDKAVSKWERGLSMPDVALLPKLSELLGADIELLLSKRQDGWEGLIDLRSFGIDLNNKLSGKPLVYYLLSHFLLLGITTVHFLTTPENQAYLSSLSLEKFGFTLLFDDVNDESKLNLMILKRPIFLFGADLTRHFQAAMHSGRPTVLEVSGGSPTFFFCPAERKAAYRKAPEQLYAAAFKRTLGRGMILINMDSPDGILDVAWFVRMYERNSGLQIADLEEISRRKGYYA